MGRPGLYGDVCVEPRIDVLPHLCDRHDNVRHVCPPPGLAGPTRIVRKLDSMGVVGLALG